MHSSLPSTADGPADDAALVARAIAGDTNAFAELIRRHRPMVAGLTRRLLDDDHLAADAVQEAVVVAMVSLPRLRRHDRFGSWLCGIALNIARRWIQQTRRLSPVADLGAEVDVQTCGSRTDELAEASIAAAQVRHAVEGLPAGQRQATVLFYLEGLSHRETAARLDISVGAVKSRLHQARSSLSSHLADNRIPQEEPSMSTTTASDTDWVDVSVTDVRAGGEPSRRLHVAILEDQAGRRLPIWVGPYEATSLAISLEAEEMPRPFTYEFTAGLLGAVSAQVVEVRVTELVEGIYYAIVVIDGPNGRQELDARPSDALNLALVADAPIRVAAAILDNPEAVDRPEWRDYSDSASHLVGELRERMAQVLRPTDDPTSP